MKRKNDLISQAIVGLFMLVTMGLLGYFTIVISGVEVLSGRRSQVIRIAFSEVGGLKGRDSVMYRGTKVGVVDEVEVTPSNLVVVARVDGNVVLRTGGRARVCNLSMLGGNYLMLEEGSGEIVDTATTVLGGETPTDWMRDVSRIAKNLNEFTSRQELYSIMTNFAAVSVKANAFMTRANAIAENADRVVSRLERGEGMIGRLVSSDDAVYQDVRRTVSSARQIAERLNRQQTFDDLEAGVAAFRDAAKSFDATETMAKANRLLDSLNAVAAELREGKGTLGRLTNDPKLYEEIDGLIRDVRQVIDNYRDTTPISTFSSLAVGAF